MGAIRVLAASAWLECSKFRWRKMVYAGVGTVPVGAGFWQLRQFGEVHPHPVN